MSFSADLSRFTKRAIDDVADVRGEIVLALFSSIVIATPVDTGAARGNWRVSVGNPIKDTIDRLDEGGEQALLDIREAVRAHKDLSDTFFLSNNLPYIEPLENGSSKQAPEGMVKRTFARIRRIIQSKTRR